MTTNSREVSPKGVTMLRLATAWHMSENDEHTGANINKPSGSMRKTAHRTNLSKEAQHNSHTTMLPSKYGHTANNSDTTRHPSRRQQIVVLPTISNIQLHSREVQLSHAKGQVGSSSKSLNNTPILRAKGKQQRTRH